MIFNLMLEWIPLPHDTEQWGHALVGELGINSVSSGIKDEVSKL